MTSEQVTAAAMVVVAFSMISLAVLAVPIALKARKSYKMLNTVLDRVHGDLSPLIIHTTSIAGNVDYITSSLRNDVELINMTLATANERVRQAMAATERRLNEFSALLSVVQDEAEDLFVSTASTVRGVRTGAARLKGDGRSGMDLASEESAEDELTDIEPEEDEYGDDSNTRGGGRAGAPATPRVRPRAHGRRRGGAGPGG